MEIRENAVWVGGLTPLQLGAAAAVYTSGIALIGAHLFYTAQATCFEAKQRYLELQCDQELKDECLPLKKAQDQNCYQILESENNRIAIASCLAIGILEGWAYLAQLADPNIWSRLRVVVEQGIC